MASLQADRYSNWLPLHEMYEVSEETELVDLITEAASLERAIYTLGSGLRTRWGSRPLREGMGVSCFSMNAVVAYQPSELMVTVQAGATIGMIEDTLATCRQWIPALAGLPRELQLGGVLACSFPRSRDWRWGRLAEAVLAMHVVTGDGTLLNLGRPVVKNAAGYRLARLFVGSWGTLGIISQVTLMTRPLPESTVCIKIALDRASFCDVLLEAISQNPLPCLSEVIVTNDVPRERAEEFGEILGPHFVIASFLLEGDAAEVEEARQLFVALAERYGWHVLFVDQNSHAETEKQLVLSSAGLYYIGCLPSQAPLLTALVSEAIPLVRWWAYLFGGQIVALEDGANLSQEKIESLRKSMTDRGASLTVLRMPERSNWPADVMWGVPRPRHVYAQRWKDFCDPKNILNPGRYIFD